ncbi:hypothetical protein K438DRAFT_1937574 [Mycena galopus ATCC 62051]|nr:hypothetical protein K438DRAFT_1937574 [Mycena galopus ATCC 62051]
MRPLTLLWVLGYGLSSKSIVLPTLRGRSVVSELSWRKPNVTQSLADVVNIASAALGKAINGASAVDQFDGQTYELVGFLYSEMAEFDMNTNQTQYEDTLQNSFSVTLETRPNFTDTETYGCAAIRAYVAYQNSVFLGYAIQAWSLAQSYTLTEGSTTFPGKNFTVETSCNGATMAGGTFLTNNTSDPSVAAMSTGYFLVLSALLSEATSDPVYLQAAIDSANFIQSHLTNSNGLVTQIISASQNDSCKILNDAVNSFNTALFMEGLAVLVSQTQNAATQVLLNELVTNTLSNPPWQTTVGIIANGDAKRGDYLLVHALAVAYVRNVTLPDLHQSLGDYLAVQFNGVVDLASNGDDTYSALWTGPPSGSFSVANQIGALTPLRSAISLVAPNTTALGSGSGLRPKPSLTPSLSRKPSKATIAGGIIGGVFAVAIAIGVFLFLRRRARARQRRATASLQPFYPQRGYSTPSDSKKSQSGYSTPWSCEKSQSLTDLPRVHVRERTRPLPGPLPQLSQSLPTPTAPPSIPVPTVNASANPDELPTERLVQLLNQRLQIQQWDAQETLPAYLTPV